MTELRCTCGAALDGVGEELLDAVEAHLDDAHRGRVPVTGAPRDDEPQPQRPELERVIRAR
jgi:hypothetical protein